MTLQSEVSRVSYSGDGSTVTFNVPFYFLLNADLRVVVRDASGSETAQTLDTDYSVSGAGNTAGGSITFTTAPASDQTVVVVRDPAVTQLTDYNDQSAFPADTHEKALDKLTMLVQRNVEKLDRAVLLKETSTFSNLDFPDPEDTKFLGWDGQVLANQETGDGSALSVGTTGKSILAASTPESARKKQAIFDTVADLKADTTLAYSSGAPTVSTDDIVEAGGFRYKVASSGASNHHVTTAGGVKLYVLPDEDGVYQIAAAVANNGDCSAFLSELATAGVGRIGATGGDTFKLDSAVGFTNPIRFTGDGVTTLVPSLGLADGNVLQFRTDDVHVEGLVLDAAGETFTPATGNTRVLMLGDGTTKYNNHKVLNNKILNAYFNDGNTGQTNLLVTHAIYCDNVNDVIITGNILDTISGACVFLRDVDGLLVAWNKFKDNAWYTVQLTEGVRHFEIINNQFQATLAQGIYWGGAVNTVGDFGLVPCSHGRIADNYFNGNYAYGAIIRIQTADDLVIEGNFVARGVDRGTIGDTNNQTLSAIRVTTRSVLSNQSEPCHNITIRNNTIHGAAGGDQRWAIYCNNPDWTTRNPMTGLRIYGNKIISDNTADYWQTGITVSGVDGGAEDIWIYDNEVSVYTQSGSTVGGAIGFSGDPTGTMKRVWLGGNTLSDIGTPSGSEHVGIIINANVDEVYQTAPNYLDNFFHGVRTVASSGPTLEGLDRQIFGTNTNDTVFSVELSRYDVPFVATATYNPGSLASGATESTDVTVTGASLGDKVETTFSLDQGGVIFTGYVRVANSVRVFLENKTGGTVDLAEGTLTVRVWKL